MVAVAHCEKINYVWNQCFFKMSFETICDGNKKLIALDRAYTVKFNYKHIKPFTFI
jgi:hypothetical protein